MASAIALRSMRAGIRPILLYAALALFSFPAFGLIVFGTQGLAYTHDVFDDAGGLVRLATAVRLWSEGPAFWDPYLTAGNAFLVQASVPPLAPDVLLALIVGPFAAFVITSWAFAFAAGVSMHLFLRDSLRLSTPAVVMGATIFLFSFVHYIFGAGVALIPLLPWLADRVAARGTRRWLLLLGWVAVAAVMLYQGLSQTTFFAAGLQLVWTLGVAARGERTSRGLTWAVAWVLALGLYAPILVSQYAALPLSQREIWVLPTFTVAEAVWTAVRHYGSVLIDIPTALRIGQSEPRYGALFMGAVGLPLLVVAIVAGHRDRRWATLVVVLAAIPFLDIAGMLVVPIQGILGPLATFQFWRVRHEFVFPLIALVAIGADVVVGILERRRPPLQGRTLVVAGVTIIGILGLMVLELRLAGRPALHALRTWEFPSSRTIGWILAAGALGLGLAVVGAAVLAAIGGRAGYLRSDRLRGAILTVIVGLFILERAIWGQADLMVNPRHGLYGTPYIGSFEQSLGVTAGIGFLLRQPDIDASRVLTFGAHANRMAYQGLHQADGYQSIYPLAYHGLFGRLIAPQLSADGGDRVRFEEWGSRAYTFGPNVDSELVRLVGARWLYVQGDEVPTVAGAIERFRDDVSAVYEVPDAFPRAFLAAGLRTATDQPAVLDALAAADLPTLRDSAFATVGQAELAGLPAGPPGPGGEATIVIDSPDRIEVDVDAHGPATLVLADVMAPGWQATRDGIPVPIATVDGAYRGVAVTGDSERVVFTYRPTATYAGFGIALLSGLAALAWALAIRRRDRRGGVVSPPRPPGDGP